MTRLSRGALALAGCTVLGVSALSAQAGTAPIVLRIPAGPRSMAFGDAYTAGFGAEVLFYNPARLIVQPGSMVALGRYGSNATIGTLATTVSVAGGFTAGFGARYLDYQALGGVPEEPGDLSTQGLVPASSLAATFALAHTLPILGVQAGAAVNYVVERRTTDAPSDAVTWSFGVTQNVGTWGVALALEDLGTHIAVAGAARDIAERLSLGVTPPSIPVGDFIDINPIAQVSVNRTHQVRPAAGIGFAYTPVIGFEFAARVGARWVDSTGVQKPSPISFGLEFTLDRLSIDYAFEPDAAGGAHRIGLRVR